jgi:hypothetical protein
MSHQIHAKGSLVLQKMIFYANAERDFYKAVAMRSSIPWPGEQKNNKKGE